MSLARRLMTVGSGTAMAQVLTAASTPVLTRVFAPEAHAIWAIFLSSSLIFSGISTLRYELAVVLPADRRLAASLMPAGFASALVWAVVAGTTIAAVGGEFFVSDSSNVTSWWWWWVPLSVVSAAAQQLTAAWCTREAAFGAYAVGQFAQPASVLVCQLSFAVLGFRDAYGLILGTVVGQLATGVGMMTFLWRRDWRHIRNSFRPRLVLATAVLYKQYPLYMTPCTLVSVLRERLAYFLLGRFGPAGSAGHYNLVVRLINLPNNLITSVVRPVFFQYAAGRDPQAMESLMLETIRAIGFVTLLLWAPCTVHAPMLMSFVFGPAWESAAPFAIVLSFPVIALMLGNWADRMLDVLGRQRLALIMEVMFSVAAMGGLVIGFWWFGDLLSAVKVQSALLTIYYVVWLLVLFRVARYQIGRLLAVLGQLLLVGAVSWSGAYVVAQMLDPLPAMLVSTTLAGTLAAVAGLLAWRRIKTALRNSAGIETSMSA